MVGIIYVINFESVFMNIESAVINDGDAMFALYSPSPWRQLLD